MTIVLAFIGLAVALAAIWGWQTISQGAAQKATNAATDRIGAYLGDEAFKPRLDALIREHLENIKKANVQDAVVADQAPAPNSDDAAADEEWHDDN